jgi:hypothetical protein
LDFSPICVQEPQSGKGITETVARAEISRGDKTLDRIKRRIFVAGLGMDSRERFFELRAS